jgi:hypothetical protein
MVKIRQEQMRAFAEDCSNELNNRIVLYLREQFPGRVAHFDNRQLYEAVDASRRRAEAYGFEWQSSVLGFVVLCFTVSPNFDRQSRVQEILTESHVPADSRIAYLADAITAAEWEEARQMGGSVLAAKAASR